MEQRALRYLGSQIWLEPDDSPERVEFLVKQAAESGIGWLRTFLMWPWIEESPEVWNFAVFDALFDACEKYDIKIKATLTANSGPWHIGTPLLLHSHTGILDEGQWPAIERYIAQCVTRYKDHPALGQWILWNEPAGAWDKSAEAHRHWQAYLHEVYGGDLSALNKRWRTGYSAFDAVRFPEEIARPEHKNNNWRSYRPYMDYARFNMRWLEWELTQIQNLVRRYDSKTPTCINPTPLLNNGMLSGIDQDALAGIVDVVGTSYHPAWSFTFCGRERFPALMAAGVKKTVSHPNVHCVEVTEVQTGNTLNSSNKPCNVEPDELARFYFAGIFAGAETVTGWLLNCRSYDFEAGDWGLLDNNDRTSPRSEMTLRVHKTLERVFAITGGFMPAESDVFVAYDPDAQCVEMADSMNGGSVPGRQADDGALGQVMLTALLMECGVNVGMCRLQDISKKGAGKVLVLSHLVAWSEENASRILCFAKSGGTVVMDCTSGRKTPDAGLYRPWPGGIAEEIGMIADGLETDPNGYEISLFGRPAGQWLLTRLIPRFVDDAPWQAWDELRYAKDGEPCVWERPLGAGRFILVNGLLGPSFFYHSANDLAIRYILQKLTEKNRSPIRPVSYRDSAFTLSLDCEKGRLSAILADRTRGREKLRIIAPPGKYTDLWSGETVFVPHTGEIALPAEDGIVLLWHSDILK